MRRIKASEFTPWQHKQEQELDRIPMPTRKNFQQQRKSIVYVQAENQTQPALQQNTNKRPRQHSLSPRRQFSYRQRAQQIRVKMHLKPIEIASIMSIGKGLVGQIAVAKKKIQSKMMEYLLLVYLSEQLKQQASFSKNQIIKQKYQCLFPLIGYAGASKELYKNRGSLNDLIDFKHI